MTKKWRIGVLGLTHDHVWGNLENFAGLENGEVAGVAEPNEALLDRVRQKVGCPVYRSHEEMVDKERPDAVYVFCDNARGAELSVWAAERGLHVMVEKPMAATLAGANRMVAAVRKAGVRMMVNWPVVWRPQVQTALALVARPEFGRIWQITHRAGHGGIFVECSPPFREWIVQKERNGGGALIDVCSYGINMASMLLGRPERVSAVTGRLRDGEYQVEDNAIVVMSYPQAMATAEGSWGQLGQPMTGYLATIWCTGGSVALGPGRGGRVWSTTAEHPQGVEITPSQPEPHMANATAHFLWALSTGNEFFPLCRDTTCRDTQEVLEAAYLAAERRQEVSLPLQTAE